MLTKERQEPTIYAALGPGRERTDEGCASSTVRFHALRRKLFAENPGLGERVSRGVVAIAEPL